MLSGHLCRRIVLTRPGSGAGAQGVGVRESKMPSGSGAQALETNSYEKMRLRGEFW